MKKIISLLIVIHFTLGCFSQQLGTFKDTRDGKIYKTVKIGKQVWMAQNLAFKQIDGCVLYEDNVKNIKQYGYLYNWESAKKACPKGWHLPSKEEWEALIKHLGGDDDCLHKLKSVTGWDEHGEEALYRVTTNETKFSAIPGGKCTKLWEKYIFSALGTECQFWTSTPYETQKAYYVLLPQENDFMQFYEDSQQADFKSIRCIKD